MIERAYELARSGSVGNVNQLIKVLTREGYDHVEAHMQGGTRLRRDLNEICRAAWVAAGNEPIPHWRKR
jgi:hypothetical protein